jgi:hypothetical protein
VTEFEVFEQCWLALQEVGVLPQIPGYDVFD